MRDFEYPPRLDDAKAANYLKRHIELLNKTLSVYERTMSESLSEMERKVNAASKLPAEVKAQVEGIAQRLDTHMSESEKRFSSIEYKVANLEIKVVQLEADIESLQQSIRDLRGYISGLG